MAPGDVNKSLEVWLPSSVSCRMRDLERWAQNPGANTASDPGNPNAAFVHEYPEEGVRRALEILQRVNCLSDDGFCQRQVGQVRLLTIGRAEDRDDLKMQVALIANRLTRYPPDVVRASCEALIEGSKWFPPMSEFIEACEWRVAKRRRLLRALERYQHARA